MSILQHHFNVFIHIQKIIKSFSFHPQIPTITILVFLTSATVNPEIEKLSYICGLRARIECEPLSEHSTHSNRVTNIDYMLSLRASHLLRKLELIVISEEIFIWIGITIAAVSAVSIAITVAISIVSGIIIAVS